MSSKVSPAVAERARVIRRIYWRMSFKIMAGAYGLIGLATLAISEFGTSSVQHELLFRVLIHHVPVWSWPTAALVIVAAVGVEGGVQDDRSLKLLQDSVRATKEARQDAQSANALLKIEQERRYEEMRPQLEARIVTKQAGDPGRGHRLEARIRSPQPLISMMAFLPSDPRTGLMRHELEAPRPGNMVFLPGMWIHVGDVSYREMSECDDDLVIRFRCRNEERTRWDDILVMVKLPKIIPSPFAFWSES